MQKKSVFQIVFRTLYTPGQAPIHSTYIVHLLTWYYVAIIP